MATLVVKNVSEDLHARLKAQAERNRRSVTMEVLTLIEHGTGAKRAVPPLSRPIKLIGGPMTDKELHDWKNDGRS